MKFSCYKKDLVDALQLVSRAVAVKPSTPILSGIYINVKGSTVELQANNHSTGIVSKIPAGVESEGSVVVSGKRFFDFVRGISGDTISIKLDDTVLTIVGSGSKVELHTMDSDTFPTVQLPDSQFRFTVNAADLKGLIKRTVFAVSKEESRPIFKGCNFSIDGNCISVGATNTHRLTTMQIKAEMDCPPCQFVVPAESLTALLSKLEVAGNSNVTIYYTERTVAFQFDTHLITSRLIEGNFPSFDRVIPKETAINVTVDTGEFADAVNFIAIMARERQHKDIKFFIDNDGIRVSAESDDIGEAIKDVEAQVVGGSITISFNVDYITDILKVIDKPQLNIGLNGEYEPITISEPDNPNYLYVVTPVRSR